MNIINTGKMDVVEANEAKHPHPEKLKTLFFRACKVGDLKALSTCIRTGLIAVDELDAVSIVRTAMHLLQQSCWLIH